MSFNVLYIEDNYLNIRLIKRYLNDLPISLSIAHDGDEGLKAIADSIPDLIIVDINLPRISGIDVIIKVRMGLKTRDVPIIAFTAETKPSVEKLCKNYGVNHYVQKPVSRKTMINLVVSFYDASQKCNNVNQIT